MRLRLEAERRGMTQLSKDSGIERSHLYKILREDANPKLDSLLKIALAIGFRLELKQNI